MYYLIVLTSLTHLNIYLGVKCCEFCANPICSGVCPRRYTCLRGMCPGGMCLGVYVPGVCVLWGMCPMGEVVHPIQPGLYNRI